jgi:hypothetical protein
MLPQFLIHILAEINSLWLSIALLSMLFLFFILKVKFQKSASLKTYGILFYAFVFYCVSAISFVLLQALNQFFNIENDVFSNFGWFFPYVLLCAIVGAFIGWLMYVSALKIAKEYVFQLMNYSLLIIAPYLFYTLLIKPFYQTISLYQVADKNLLLPQDINFNNIESYTEKIDSTVMFMPAVPAQLFDSLLIQAIGSNIKITNNRNDFSYQFPVAIKPIHQIYVAQVKPYKQLVLLVLAPVIQSQASLLIIDSLGMVNFEKKIEDGSNRLSISLDNKYARLQQANVNDSIQFKQAFLLKP